MDDEQTTPGADVSDDSDTYGGLFADLSTDDDEADAESFSDGRPLDDDTEGDTSDDDEADQTSDLSGVDTVDDLPPWAQKLIREARKGEGDYRKRAQEEAAARAGTEEKLQGFLDGFARVMGLQADADAAESDQASTPPNPEQLTEKLQTTQREYRATQVELAVFRRAAEFDGDPDALLDSRAFLNKVRDLDPASPKFGENVAAAIGDAVASNPKLKAQTPMSGPTPPSGGEFAGGPSGRVDTESLTVDDFRKRRASRRG